MHQTVIENRGLRFSTLLAGFSMELLCNCEEFLEKICGGLAETTAGKLIVMFSKTLRRVLKMEKVCV
ncbi:unnamed protein product [Brassica oleracea var. botrytis]